MFWLPLIFAAAGAAGAIMQANGKKYIDPAWIDEHFGSHAFAKEFQNNFNMLQSTSYGQELINSAMSQGQQLANTIRQNATNAGFGGAEGVQSGGSLFASSTADQAPSSMRRLALSQIAQQAQTQTQNFLDKKLAAIMGDQGRPTAMGNIGTALAGLGAAGLSASLNQSSGGGKTGTDTTKAATPKYQSGGETAQLANQQTFQAWNKTMGLDASGRTPQIEFKLPASATPTPTEQAKQFMVPQATSPPAPATPATSTPATAAPAENKGVGANIVKFAAPTLAAAALSYRGLRRGRGSRLNTAGNMGRYVSSLPIGGAYA